LSNHAGPKEIVCTESPHFFLEPLTEDEACKPAVSFQLSSGDQLFAIDGKEMTKVTEIQDALAEKGWGKDVSVTILREGERREIIVKLPPLEQ
jgi:S1-C subfamily serine protease